MNFKQYFLDDISDNIFDKLKLSCTFEKTGKGRLGANLFEITENMTYPIVRTTTKYNNRNQHFKKIHYELINKIKFITQKNINFNNAMIEIYDNTYKDMRYHTDQMLDLENNSYICIFSCYAHNIISNRYLKIENKTDKSVSNICLENNSIILFDLNTNKNHLHKIYLSGNIKNEWLGITFRLSKTFIKFINEIPFFCNNDNLLRFATQDDEIQLRHNKSSENSLINFTYQYDLIDYTISFGDCLEPIKITNQIIL